MNRIRTLALFLALAMGAPALHAADKVTHLPVKFAKGASGATLSGGFAGYDSVEYSLAARAGQTLHVRVQGQGAQFNVFAPGDRPGSATAIGTGYAGADWTGTLPASGAYTIQVYQMRASARRGARVAYTIRFDVSGAATQRAAPAATKRAFDASGKVPCAAARGQPMGQCPFVVTRRPAGVTTVLVTHGDGHTRALYFQGGKAVGTDLPAGGAAFSAAMESDLFLIRADNERYEIPDVVVSGD